MKKRIILRADGNTTIGLGHVYRLLALADMLRADYQIAFAIAKPDDFLKNTILLYVHEIVELPFVFTYISPFLKLPEEEILFDLMNIIEGTEIVVTDGYWFGTNYQRAVKKTGAKLVCVDDLAETYFVADAVINHAPGVLARQYRGESYTKYYLGLDYAMLRKDFFKPFQQNRIEGSLLIGLGGTDQCEITGKVLDAAIRSNFFSQIHLITSPLFSEIQNHYLQLVSHDHPQRVILYENLDASQLSTLMDTCSYAIVSASTMLIECYSRGLICFSGYYTNNQLNIYNGFISQNLAFGLGDFNNFDVHVINSEIENHARNQLVLHAHQPLNSVINIQKLFLKLC